MPPAVQVDTTIIESDKIKGKKTKSRIMMNIKLQEDICYVIQDGALICRWRLLVFSK